MRWKRPSPAMVVALVALFLSLGGAGLAASRYLITSVAQITPNVRAALGAGKPYYTSSHLQLLHSTGVGSVLFAHCGRQGRLLTGGFEGAGEIVTESRPNVGGAATGGPNPNWEVIAHRDPAVPGWSTAYALAWALCLPDR